MEVCETTAGTEWRMRVGKGVRYAPHPSFKTTNPARRSGITALEAAAMR